MPQHRPRPAVRPRDAASLVVYRTGPGGVSVLLGRRRARSRFMPHWYVFPGGVIEPGDWHLVADTRRPSAAMVRSMGCRSPAHARALGHAAIRECAEETGLRLERPGRLAPSARGSWQDWRRRGKSPDPSTLVFLGRAITPTDSRWRYHARFFAVPARAFVGRLSGDGELEDLRWVPCRDRSRVPLLDVTEFMLDRLQEYLDTGRPRPRLICYRGESTLDRAC